MRLVVCTFYKFVALPDPASLRGPLTERLMNLGIKGTVLVAREGINGTIAGEPEAVDKAMDYLRSHQPFSNLESKQSFANGAAFGRLKVRLKAEIVSMRVAGIDPTRSVGTYVEPENWNALISDPDVIVIDTRNHFESRQGTFERAIDPNTSRFSEFPHFVRRELLNRKDRPIAMFCTGGIRCEKATSFMLREGFEKVYHLKGGILKYLEEIPAETSLWKGRCFVFDERGGLGHGLGILPDSAKEP